MDRHFDAAPWPLTLKLVSGLATVALIIASIAVFRKVPTASGFGYLAAAVPLLVLAGSLFFGVSGYSLEGNRLQVHRLVTTTAIPLDGLARIRADPDACKGSLRVFGNGGLFAFTGWFYNRSLGRYRAFVTDFRHAVVLRFPDRVVVISPADPKEFVRRLAALRPRGLQVESGQMETRAGSARDR